MTYTTAVMNKLTCLRFTRYW